MAITHSVYDHISQFPLIKGFLFFSNIAFENMMSIFVSLYYTDLQSLVPVENSPSEEFVQEENACNDKLY